MRVTRGILQGVEEEEFGVAGGGGAEVLVAASCAAAAVRASRRVMEWFQRVSRMRMLPSGSVMVRVAPFFTAATPSLWR